MSLNCAAYAYIFGPESLKQEAKQEILLVITEDFDEFIQEKTAEFLETDGMISSRLENGKKVYSVADLKGITNG